MVDAADHEKLDASKSELHSLLEKPQLSGIPVIICLLVNVCCLLPLVIIQVLVLGNKVDLPNALREKELIERM